MHVSSGLLKGLLSHGRQQLAVSQFVRLQKMFFRELSLGTGLSHLPKAFPSVRMEDAKDFIRDLNWILKWLLYKRW